MPRLEVLCWFSWVSLFPGTPLFVQGENGPDLCQSLLCLSHPYSSVAAVLGWDFLQDTVSSLHIWAKWAALTASQNPHFLHPRSPVLWSLEVYWFITAGWPHLQLELIKFLRLQTACGLCTVIWHCSGVCASWLLLFFFFFSEILLEDAWKGRSLSSAL